MKRVHKSTKREYNGEAKSDLFANPTQSYTSMNKCIFTSFTDRSIKAIYMGFQ